MIYSASLSAQEGKLRMKKKTVTYKDAGVDLNVSDKMKAGIGRKVRSTFSSRVLSDIGLFGGLFDIAKTGMRHPILVTSVDGVGTKTKIAAMMRVHSTVGQDIVAHCANDIAVQGAKPLFFLDYIGCSKLTGQLGLQIIEGVVRGCKRAGCSLLGGETAEMPGVYSGGDYDLVGVITGIVDKGKIIDGRKVRAGDVVIGLPSSGLHTNGYSLARKIFFEVAGFKPTKRLPELSCSVGEELLKVHRDYSRVLLGLIRKFDIHAAAHITGGGFPGNIPRVLPEGLGVVIDKRAWEPLPVFKVIQGIGNVPDEEMYRTFNMGIGMVVIVAEKQAKDILRSLARNKLKSSTIGHVEKLSSGKSARLVYSN
jgi:phosphoribosylformylglycinamidine cyclo-ligase